MEGAVVRKLRFVRAWRSYRTGDVVDVPGGLAAQLIATNVAVEDRQANLLETAAVEQPTETADATPRRRRKRGAVPDAESRNAAGG